MEIRFNKSDSLIFKGLRIWTRKHQFTYSSVTITQGTLGVMWCPVHHRCR